MRDNTLTTACTCSDPSHIMAFCYYEDMDPGIDELYVAVQLNPFLPWWKRSWAATQYIFGKRSRYSSGHWDESSISLESAKELRAFLNKYINHNKIKVAKGIKG